MSWYECPGCEKHWTLNELGGLTNTSYCPRCGVGLDYHDWDRPWMESRDKMQYSMEIVIKVIIGLSILGWLLR